MSEQVRNKAIETEAEVQEVSEATLPMPRNADDLVALDKADAPVAEEIRARMDEIDLSDTNSIVSFGSAAQGEHGK